MKLCEYCGVNPVYGRKPCEIEKSRFCSRSCSGKYKLKSVSIFCISCGQEFIGGKDRKFCSQSCSATYNNTGKKKSEYTKNKTSNTICNKYGIPTREERYIICKFCGLKIYKPKLDAIFCSQSCLQKYRWQNNRESICLSLRKKSNKDKRTWHVRTKQHQTYPEKYFESVIINNLEWEPYIPERKIIKSKYGEYTGTYFIDFYFPRLRLALEIDGNQHEKEIDKHHDVERDSFLNSIGISVFRIKWRNPSTKEGREYLDSKIKQLLNIINGGNAGN